MKSRTIFATVFFVLASIMTFSDALARPPLPNGSYLQSCVNCRTSGYSLSCWCRSGSRTKPKYSRLHFANQCLFVENNSGNLHCARGRISPLPEGSYQNDCRACSFDGKILSCTCLSRIGLFEHQVELLDADQCNKDIAYTRGGLKCLSPSPYHKSAVTPVAHVAPAVASVISEQPVAAAPVNVISVIDSKPVASEPENKTVETKPEVKPANMRTFLEKLFTPKPVASNPVTEQPKMNETKVIEPLSAAPVVSPVAAITEKWSAKNLPAVKVEAAKVQSAKAEPVKVAQIDKIVPAETNLERKKLAAWVSSLLVSAEKEVVANQKTIKTVKVAALAKRELNLSRSEVVDPVVNKKPEVKPQVVVQKPAVKTWKPVNQAKPAKQNAQVLGQTHKPVRVVIQSHPWVENIYPTI